MITAGEPECTLSDNIFGDALEIIDRSGAAELIDAYYEESTLPGGRPPRGIEYTTRAVLVALLGRIILCRPPTLRGAMATIADFTPGQLTAVGMGGQDCSNAHRDSFAEYKRFHPWWIRRLAPLDPGLGLPARRVTNATHAAALAARTMAQRADSHRAAERIRTVINRIVAGSVREDTPAGSRGDLVVDESIYDLAGPGQGLGSRPDKHRGAAYCGRYYVRDAKTGAISDPRSVDAIKKAAFGLGLTAVTRIGKPDALHGVAPVIIGIDIHPPTSGSVDGLAVALEQAKRNGIDGRNGGRSRWPYLTIDMGYNPKKGFAELMLQQCYSPVARYPKHWNTTFASTNPTGAPNGPQPGPVQAVGAFYCPAVQPLLRGHRTPAMRDLLATDGFRAHDDRLARILPYLMGYNSRPFQTRSGYGRRKLGIVDDTVAKVKLVCPAALGAVKCPLKPESMVDGPVGVPLAAPDWDPSDRGCCANSSVTVTLTPDQLRMAQWDLVPGSWEHSIYFEAARAFTEQRFSLLKSKNVTSIAELKWGPRREPMIKLILALAVAAANRRSQLSHDPKRSRAESIDIRWRQLATDLGREPTRTPPRT
ncbi:hypothetical protein [Antrihabitans cavernicola]|uniref:Transposase n=1 Tax=Antrihabitans cavernicola TaxID=2495913 RepID=A0A5A7SHS3_9NOCA|nr:hypothetical protein [Spelaeibacter cavernicola]KAA0024909.1 hypothetical protein FOY51_03015 [Spelaeibacter cavernicola]